MIDNSDFVVGPFSNGGYLLILSVFIMQTSDSGISQPTSGGYKVPLPWSDRAAQPLHVAAVSHAAYEN
jgi:hypothetical protein